jgi:hypothetical protein
VAIYALGGFVLFALALGFSPRRCDGSGQPIRAGAIAACELGLKAKPVGKLGQKLRAEPAKAIEGMTDRTARRADRAPSPRKRAVRVSRGPRRPAQGEGIGKMTEPKVTDQDVGKFDEKLQKLIKRAKKQRGMLWPSVVSKLGLARADVKAMINKVYPGH